MAHKKKLACSSTADQAAPMAMTGSWPASCFRKTADARPAPKPRGRQKKVPFPKSFGPLEPEIIAPAGVQLWKRQQFTP